MQRLTPRGPLPPIAPTPIERGIIASTALQDFLRKARPPQVHSPHTQGWRIEHDGVVLPFVYSSLHHVWSQLTRGDTRHFRVITPSGIRLSVPVVAYMMWLEQARGV